MIRYNKKPNPPQILIDNAQNWTKALLNAIQQYGSYSDIPASEKTSLLSHYKHQEIKTHLYTYDPMKCCFCECIPSESGHLEIEHFHAKSLYPEKTFEWDNLLPICRICNGNKSALDTVASPIVHPVSDNPEVYFTYNFLRIIPSPTAPDVTVATLTIHEKNGLDLNNSRLLSPRSELLVALHSYENQLSEFIEKYNTSIQQSKKSRMMSQLISSMQMIDNLTGEKQKHAGFCRWYIEQSEIIQEAKKLISKDAKLN